MESLSIGLRSELPEPQGAREGVSGRYSRSRTRAASRRERTRGGRTEEAQVERGSRGRSERGDKTRSSYRNRRLRSKGRSRTHGSQQGNTAGEVVRSEEPRAQVSAGAFDVRLQSKTRAASKVLASEGGGKPTETRVRQETPALAAAVTLTKPAASAAQTPATPSIAKVAGRAVPGAVALPLADGESQTKGAKQRASVSGPREAAPPPSHDQASDVLRQVRLQLFPEARTATIYLKPAELGRVSIRLVMDGDSLQAIVRAETPEALAALEQHMPELQASLADRGFEDAQLELALGFEGEDEEQLSGARAVEPKPDQIQRLFANAEGVDFYA